MRYTSVAELFNPYESYVTDKHKKTHTQGVRELVSRAKEHSDAAKGAAGDIIKNMFMLGCVLNEQPDKIPTEEMAKILRIKIHDILAAEKLAKDCNHSLMELKKYLVKHKLTSWGQTRKIVQGDKRSPVDAGMLQTKMSASIKEIEDHGKNSEPLLQVMQKMMQRIPMKKEIADKMHVKYHRCVCCLEEPPPDGHRYVYNDKINLHIPICQRCYDMDNPIDYLEVAKMYSTYAVNMEVAFDKIYLDGDEDSFFI